MITLLSPALLAFYEAASDTQKLNTVIKGELSLLSYPEFTTSDIRKINETLLKPSKFNFENLLKPGKVSILLGSETGKQEFKEAAIISACYEVSGVKAGSISLVGPMRMDYSRTASAVEHAAKVLGNMLTILRNEI